MVDDVMVRQGPANADAETGKICTAVGEKALDTVMSAIAAVLADPQAADGQVHIVIRDVDIRLVDLIPAHERADGATAFIHVSLRLDQDDFFTVHGSLGYEGVHLILPQGHIPALG